MSKSYINTGFKPGRSDYADTDIPDGLINSMAFANKSVVVKTQQGDVRMVTGNVSLSAPFVVSCGDDNCFSTQLTEMVKLSWNIRNGDEGSTLASLRDEVNRIFDLAIAEYGALKGLNPPATATFFEE